MIDRDWLSIKRGNAPLLLGLPHAGTHIEPDLEARFGSPWLARKDADWWVDRLYAFAEDLDATVIRTAISRSVIDVNRDPAGISLYPGQATTGLCPTTTFDGDPLYVPGEEPDSAEIETRRDLYFNPYHAAMEAELKRLRSQHGHVVLYDCHSIRSHVERLFLGELPQFNIGTNFDSTCDPALTAAVERDCAATGLGYVVNGRFRGGYTTRHYGRPAEGVHAIQMELACRGYMIEPVRMSPDNWPSPFDAQKAAPMIGHLRQILKSCLQWARQNQRV